MPRSVPNPGLVQNALGCNKCTKAQQRTCPSKGPCCVIWVDALWKRFVSGLNSESQLDFPKGKSPKIQPKSNQGYSPAHIGVSRLNDWWRWPSSTCSTRGFPQETPASFYRSQPNGGSKENNPNNNYDSDCMTSATPKSDEQGAHADMGVHGQGSGRRIHVNITSPGTCRNHLDHLAKLVFIWPKMHPWPKPRFPSLFSGAVDLKGPSPPPNKKRKKVPALDSLPARPRPRALALKPSHRTPAPPPSQHRSPENWLSLTDRGILALVGALVACPGTKRGFKSSVFNPIEGHVSMPWVSLLMNPPDVTASAPNGCVCVKVMRTPDSSIGGYPWV